MPNSSFLDRLAVRLQPVGISKAIDDRALVAKVLLAVVAGAAINVGALIVIQFAFDEVAAGLVSLGQWSITVVMSLYAIVTGRIAALAYVALWAAVVTVVTIHVLLGGYAWSGGYVLWGISNIVLASLWLPVSGTALMTAFYLVVVPVFAVLEPTLQDLRGERPDPALATAHSVMIFFGTTLLIAPAALLMREKIFDERTRVGALMRNVLPEPIADRLQRSQGVIAERHDDCTILFADLVGFTEHSRAIEPEQLVRELNGIFSAFDHIVAAEGGEKIKTIGDGYMAAFGVPADDPDHAAAACRTAGEMVATMPDLNRELGTSFEMRVGIATGPVVAGVIGESKFSYDLWSDTVILASRLEAAARPGQVLVSSETAGREVSGFGFSSVGELSLKGRGPTQAYELRRSDPPSGTS